MTRHCTPGIKLANCWLAGMTYDDVLKEEWYRALPDFVRIQGANIWISLENAFGIVCFAMVDGKEQAPIQAEWARRRSLKHKWRHR